MALQKGPSHKQLYGKKATPPAPIKTIDIIAGWCKAGYYVYLRPVNGKLVDATADGKVYWNVTVEHRNVPPVQKRGEGWDLDEVIRDVATKMASPSPKQTAKPSGTKSNGSPQKPSGKSSRIVRRSSAR